MGTCTAAVSGRIVCGASVVKHCAGHALVGCGVEVKVLCAAGARELRNCYRKGRPVRNAIVDKREEQTD